MPQPQTKKPRAKKIKPEELQQIDGKNHEAEKKKLIKRRQSRDAIWGFKNSQYKTEDPKEYEAYLRKMPKFDLQRECTRVGREAHDNREIMIERLMKDFRVYVAGATGVGLPDEPLPKPKMSERSRQILARTATLLA